MAKFFKGQRVRIVKSTSGREGKEGVVTTTELFGHSVVCGYGCYVGVVSDCGIERFGPEHWYEPILYDGAQPIAESFEEMMGKLREGVVA